MENSTDKRTEYVSFRVTPEDKKKIEAQNESYKLQIAIINEGFLSEKNWIKNELSTLDDNILQYRAMLLKTREAVLAAQKEHSDKLNEMWDEIAQGIPSFKSKVERIVSELKPISESITQINATIKNQSTYQIESLQKVVESFSRMSETDKQLFNVLLNHVTKPL